MRISVQPCLSYGSGTEGNWNPGLIVVTFREEGHRIKAPDIAHSGLDSFILDSVLSFAMLLLKPSTAVHVQLVVAKGKSFVRMDVAADFWAMRLMVL